LRCTGQNKQLTAINAHVGYVLFTVVMTTFTVAPSSGVPYADALLKNAVRKQNGGVIQRYDGDCWLRAGCRRKSERKCDIGATHCPMKFGTVTAELW